MTYADGGVEVSEAPFDDFVQVDSGHVVIAEEGMLGEHGFESIRFGSHQNDMLEHTGALMPMDDVNMLTNQNLSDQGQRVEHRQEGDVSLEDWELRDVVDLEPVSHMAETAPGVLELICYKANLVPSFYEALSQLVAVSLNSTKLREGEVGADKNTVLPAWSLLPVGAAY